MKLFSIQRRLLVTLLISVLVTWLIALGFGYQKAQEEIYELSDARLQQAAQVLLVLDLKRLTRLVDGVDSAAQKHGEVEKSEAEPLAFQIWNAQGELILQNEEAPVVAALAKDGFSSIAINTEMWRRYSVFDKRHGYRVVVLEPLKVRDHPVQKFTVRMLQILMIGTPLLIVLVWGGVRHGLAPLGALSKEIARRDAASLVPIALKRVPLEAEGLVHTLNALLGRLAKSLDQERAFTADAAHELRTPLAAIKIQAEVALAATDDDTRRKAVEQVIAGVNRATHLVQQLLQLARIDQGEKGQWQKVDVAELAARVLSARAESAIARGIELSLDAKPHIALLGEPTLLFVLIDNLVDNAIKYGRAGGAIEVHIRKEAAAVTLEVADDGNGVDETERARLFDRFYRREGESASGSGLGLSIVRKIVELHQAQLSIGQGLHGKGLKLTVTIPQ